MIYRGTIIHTIRYCVTDKTIENYIGNIREIYERNALEILFRVKRTHRCVAKNTQVIHTGTAIVYFVYHNKIYCDVIYSFSRYERTILYTNNYYNAAINIFRKLPSETPILLRLSNTVTIIDDENPQIQIFK